MNASPHKRVTLEINLDTLHENFRRIAERVAPCQVMAVLKANAYGLGVRPIADALIKVGAARIGVAELGEALQLQGCGVPVQVLGGVLPDEIPDAVNAGVTLPVTDPETAQHIDSEARRQNRNATVHALIDTGMGRLGILPKDAVRVIQQTARLPHLKLEGVYTHFPVAYLGGIDFTRDQVATFLGIVDTLKQLGIPPPLLHAANSDAVNNVPDAFAPPFNLVRTGINLYGAFDPEGQRSLSLESVLTLRTRLVALRRLPAGTTLGYGRTCTLPEDTTVGTIAAGYADGLPLALSNRGHVLIRGKRCPVLGRVSMDYTTVDLSAAPDAQIGDTVVCLGRDGEAEVHVEDWAQIKGTHSYDIICSIGTRVAREYAPTSGAGSPLP